MIELLVDAGQERDARGSRAALCGLKINRDGVGTPMSNEDSAVVTGFVHSINVGKLGIEVNVVNPEIEAAAPKDRPYFTCRLDRSNALATMMCEIAMNAMLNNLAVTLIGAGDDRDDTLEFHELRVLADGQTN